MAGQGEGQVAADIGPAEGAAGEPRLRCRAERRVHAAVAQPLWRQGLPRLPLGHTPGGAQPDSRGRVQHTPAPTFPPEDIRLREVQLEAEGETKVIAAAGCWVVVVA